MSNEKSKLIGQKATTISAIKYSNSLDSLNNTQEKKHDSLKGIKLKKNIGIVHATGTIVGTVIGSGIFISPTNVTANIGSVGGSLVIWAATGLYVFMQAWCYAELATIMPVAGGDYAYNYIILGPCMGFVVGWVHLVLKTPATVGAVAQAAGLYIAQAAGLADNTLLKTLIAILLICEEPLTI